MRSAGLFGRRRGGSSTTRYRFEPVRDGRLFAISRAFTSTAIASITVRLARCVALPMSSIDCAIGCPLLRLHKYR